MLKPQGKGLVFTVLPVLFTPGLEADQAGFVLLPVHIKAEGFAFIRAFINPEPVLNLISFLLPLRISELLTLTPFAVAECLELLNVL
jgi:hypothetical protein